MHVCVEGGGDEIPVAGFHRGVCGQLVTLSGAGPDPQLQIAFGSEKESESGLLLGRPFGHDPLRFLLLRGGRIDPGLQGDAAQLGELRRIGHHDIGAAVSGLLAAVVTATDGGVDDFLFDAGAVGVLVAVNQAHQGGFVGW